MATAEIMDKCKEKLGIDTDYKLSKVMDISNARLSDYRKGTRVPDEYACFRFAEILGESPSALIARVQAENTKSESKRLFFKSFLTAVGLWITLAVIPVFLDSSLGTVYAAGKHAETRANIDVTAHYTK